MSKKNNLNISYLVVGLSHMCILLCLMILYFEFKPENFILLHDIMVILSFISVNTISINVVFSILKISDKYED